MKKQSILIACQSWHEEVYGGAFKLAGEFAQYLANQGYDVHFLCGTEETGYSNPTYKYGMQFWRYSFPKSPSPGVKNLWGHLYNTWSLTRQITRETDIAYFNGHSALQFLAGSYAVKHGCHKVFSLHSPFVEESKARWMKDNQISFKYKFALSVVRQLERMMYIQSDIIQCYSAYTLSVINEQYPRDIGNKGIVCPGWVDLNRFQPSKDRNETRKRLGDPWKIGIPTFLSVRRLERRMGLDNLISACSILKTEGYKFQVLIGGAGPLQHEFEYDILRLELQEYVYLLGRISEQDLPLTYAAADCFVLPTRSLECFGLIVLEAFACNTPVIATPVGSIPEVMGEYGNMGWLSSDTSAIAIVDQMRAFLNGELKTDYSNLREHAVKYTTSEILPKLEGIVFGSA